MKKFQYFLMVMLVALVLVGFASCGDDEPEGTDIVGTWQYDNPDETANFDLIYQFTKDGVFNRVTIFHELSYGRRNFVVSSGTYTLSGKKVIISFDNGGEVVSTENPYSVQGDKLKFIGGDEPTFTRVDDSVIEPYL